MILDERLNFSFVEINSIIFSSSNGDAFINAFCFCSITRIHIPSSVISIESNAFGNYHSLSSIEIPVSVSSVELFVFFNYKSITREKISSSVTSVGSYIFLIYFIKKHFISYLFLGNCKKTSNKKFGLIFF